MNKIAKYLIKKANPAYDGYNGMALQQFLPVQQHRDLSEKELEKIEKEQKKIIPKIFKSKKDNPAVDMSSPVWNSAMLGLAGAGAGGLLGAFYDHRDIFEKDPSMSGRLTGATIGGGLGGLVGYLSRKAKNESIEDAMARLPEGATRRDIMSDPVYWREREMEMQRNAVMGNRGITAGLVANLLRN